MMRLTGAAHCDKGKSSSRKADVIQLTPERVWDGEAEGVEPAVAEVAAAAAQQGCVVCFSTPELTLAGLYTLTAEYVEGRPELLPAMPKPCGPRSGAGRN